jgi:hypothetical protein
MEAGWSYHTINEHNSYSRWCRNIISICWSKVVGLKYYVKMPKSLKINVKEIKFIETAFDPLVDLDGPICEE